MENYKEYTYEELITDSYFIEWVKYPTNESDAFWNSVIGDNPNKVEMLGKAKIAVESLVIASKQAAPASDILKIWGEIKNSLHPKKVYHFKSQFKKWVAAASVLLLIGIGGWLNKDKFLNGDRIYAQLIEKSSNPLKEVVNTTNNSMAVTLPDSSRAILEPNSRLSFNNTFSNDLREVYLSGEAFFEVKKNPKKPFFVYSNLLVTRVLGTSFTVRAYPNDNQIAVKVKSGKVSVYRNNVNNIENPQVNGIILTPNQQGIFDKDIEKYTRSLIEKPEILFSEKKISTFSFRDTSVEEIFSVLEKSYGVDIIYDRELMATCELTTSLNNENLFEKLDIICAGIDASYKVVDAQIIISGKGCN